MPAGLIKKVNHDLKDNSLQMVMKYESFQLYQTYQIDTVISSIHIKQILCIKSILEINN